MYINYVQSKVVIELSYVIASIKISSLRETSDEILFRKFSSSLLILSTCAITCNNVYRGIDSTSLENFSRRRDYVTIPRMKMHINKYISCYSSILLTYQISNLVVILFEKSMCFIHEL